MEKLKRTIFFWTLVALFIIIAPLVVLYARGFRFDLHRGVFVHSGTITLKSNPQSADTYIDGKLVSSSLNRINNSNNISGLIPGTYDISVQKDGFQTWEKKTDVHSGLSSEFWNILQVRDNYDRTAYETPGVENFFVSPRSKKIVTAQNSSDGLSAKIVNSMDHTQENAVFFAGWQLIDASRKENIEWSPEEDFLTVPVQKTIKAALPKQRGVKAGATQDTTEYAYFLVDMTTGQTTNLNEFFGIKEMRNLRWDPQQKGFLFFLSGNILYRADITKSSDPALIDSEISSYDISGYSVYYSKTPNELVYKSSLDGSNKVQLTSSFPSDSVVPTSKLIIYDDSRFAFLDQNQNLFIYNKGEHDNYFRQIGSNVEGMQFSNDGKKMLFWTNNEISVYFLRDWTVQPIRSEDELSTITRYSETLRNVQWFKDYEHIIFSVGPQTKIIELDPRDHRNCMELPRTTVDNPSAVYDSGQEKLYFIDAKDSTTELYSIDFPESTGILGIGGA